MPLDADSLSGCYSLINKHSETFQSQNNCKGIWINVTGTGLKSNIDQSLLKSWADQVE